MKRVTSDAGDDESKQFGQPKPPPAGPHRFESFHGAGRAVVRHHAGSAVLSHLHFTFPLKLMSPKTASQDATARILRWRDRQRDPLIKTTKDGGLHTPPGMERSSQTIKAVSAIYIVGYGGGLISGDSVLVDFDIGSTCTGLLLTQGSTKVYKMRTHARRRPTDATGQQSPTALTTRQELRCIVRPNATLIVLPDTVTCYAQARYSQVQRFDLRCQQTSSLVLLDWFTPGRVHLDHSKGQTNGQQEAHDKEKWSFESYASRNEVRIEGHIVARDVLLLEHPQHFEHKDHNAAAAGPSIAQRCEPYSIYASLFLFGPDVQTTVSAIASEFHAIQQRTRPSLRQDALDPILWSCSPITMSSKSATSTSSTPASLSGCVVRVAGLSTEIVRHWLRNRLLDLQGLIGDDLYRQALG